LHTNTSGWLKTIYQHWSLVRTYILCETWLKPGKSTHSSRIVEVVAVIEKLKNKLVL